MYKIIFAISILFLVLGCAPQVQPIQTQPNPTKVIPSPQNNSEVPLTVTVTSSTSKIAFVRNYNDYYKWDIFTANSDGSNIERITADASNDSRPALSPDSTQIVFESIREWHGFPSIYTMDAKGSNIKCLTPEVKFCKSPTWSPDGSKIAYCIFKNIGGAATLGSGSTDSFSPDIIFIMDKDGNNKQYIIKGFSPSWFPDGQHIAFLANRTGTWIICTTSIDGTNGKEYQTCLSPSSCGIHYLAKNYPALSVSPDGKSATFDSCDYTGRRDIYVMAFANGQVTKLTGSIPTSCYSPTWSPDGSKIVFTIESSDGSTGQIGTDIYIIDANGSNPMLLIKDGMFPSLSRVIIK